MVLQGYPLEASLCRAQPYKKTQLIPMDENPPLGDWRGSPGLRSPQLRSYASPPLQLLFTPSSSWTPGGPAQETSPPRPQASGMTLQLSSAYCKWLLNGKRDLQPTHPPPEKRREGSDKLQRAIAPKHAWIKVVGHL